MFSIEQLNQASTNVPLGKRYRYPQQQTLLPQQAPTTNHHQTTFNYQQPNMATGYPTAVHQQQIQTFPQQTYPAPSYSPFVNQNSNANYFVPTNQPQPQFVSNLQPMTNPLPSNFSYDSNLGQTNYNTNQQFNPSQLNQGQFPAQTPQMNKNNQSQFYNPYGNY